MGDMADWVEGQGFSEMMLWDTLYKECLQEDDEDLVAATKDYMERIQVSPTVSSICSYYSQNGFITEKQKEALAAFWAEIELSHS